MGLSDGGYSAELDSLLWDAARSWTSCCGIQRRVGLAAVGYSTELQNPCGIQRGVGLASVGYSAELDSLLWDTARFRTPCCGIQCGVELLTQAYSAEPNYQPWDTILDFGA